MIRRPQPTQRIGPIQGGIKGVVGGVKSLGQIINLARPYFAPASTQTAPLSTTATGNRQITRPQQTQVVKLTSGKAIWRFNTPYAAKPSVQLTAEGAPSGVSELYFTFITVAGLTGTLAYVGVSLASTTGSDARYVHVTATGNPN